MRFVGIALKGIGWLAAGLLGLICSALLLFALLFQLSVPEHGGTIELAGLSAPATLERDDLGILTITADSEEDAAFALGYAHAQDRLFQMELMRRSASGRMAEAIGKPGVGIDRFMRVLGLRRLADQAAQDLPDNVRAVMQAYADGVNAYLAEPGGLLPPEFQFLPEPEPWTITDSLLFPKLMALQLSGNWFEELQRAALLTHLPASKVQELWPEEETDAPYTLDVAGASDLDRRTLLAVLDGMAAALKPTLASNAWAVSGTRTVTGKPLLASDPHLGLQLPPMWYLARIEYPGGSLGGATVPGVPMMIIGHNGHVAWGFTTTHSDTADLFIERVYNDDTYETPDGRVPLDVREETIPVRFGDDVTIRIRESRHGPLISDHPGFGGDMTAQQVAGDGQALALSFAALQPGDRTAVAQYNLIHAEDVFAFRDALRDFHSPQQNVIFADTDGNIGFMAPARVPIRAQGRGLTPKPGWDDNYAWTGWIPFEDLPQVINPPAGKIVNGNNRIVGPDYPYLIAADWPPPYRAERIETGLEGGTALSVGDMVSLQMDSVSAAAQDLLPLLLANTETKPETAEVRALLADWDGLMAVDLAQPLIFNAWMDRLSSRLIRDDLGDDLVDRMRILDPRVIKRMIANEDNWCDNIATPRTESCTDTVTSALDEALEELEALSGPDIRGWRWGDFHKAGLDHPIFGMIPGLKSLASRAPETDGDNFTVNRGGHASLTSRSPFKHRHGAGLRAVFDLNDLSQSVFTIAGGQSGHLLSDVYDTFADPWAAGQSVTLGGRPVTSTTTLVPAPAPQAGVKVP